MSSGSLTVPNLGRCWSGTSTLEPRVPSLRTSPQWGIGCSSLPVIRSLVAVCPLLGLLGTVTGMIEVFDVMAIAGAGNARAMAAGGSKATIPTMAGMVAALSGLAVSAQLDRFARDRTQRLADHLVHH